MSAQSLWLLLVANSRTGETRPKSPLFSGLFGQGRDYGLPAKAGTTTLGSKLECVGLDSSEPAAAVGACPASVKILRLTVHMGGTASGSVRTFRLPARLSRALPQALPHSLIPDNTPESSAMADRPRRGANPRQQLRRLRSWRPGPSELPVRPASCVHLHSASQQSIRAAPFGTVNRDRRRQVATLVSTDEVR